MKMFYKGKAAAFPFICRYMVVGVMGLKSVERFLIKVIIIQFVFLFLSQLFFHQIDIFPQIKQLTRYEGVNENTFTEILQTFQDGGK